MAFKHVNQDEDVWVRVSNAGGDIQDIMLTISIRGEIIRFRSCLVEPRDEGVAARLPLSIEAFINYLARHALTDLDANTSLFRAIIECIRQACSTYYTGSFMIEIGWRSWGLDPRYFPSARTIWVAPDGTKVIGRGVPKQPFAYPEPEFLLVRR